MLIALAIGLTILALASVLYIRPTDIPQPPPPDPFKVHDERKARIYENLRDLQFELRLGKLSDEDYATAKAGLQKELAQVLAEVEALKESLKASLSQS